MKKEKIFFIVCLQFCIISGFLISSENPNNIKKKTICLNMIVKDESDVITRCLESVLPIIDTWVIVDTGSTDGTQKIIKDYLKNIPGELYERPWVNFEHNRQEALLLAKPKADYILFMDADDMLTYSDDFQMPELTQGFYGITSHLKNGEEFIFHRLIKSDLDWFWKGAIHEDLLCSYSVNGEHLKGITYEYNHDGARSKDSDSWNKDVAILLDSIQKDPTNTRNYFYLARSYQNGGDLEHALEYYKKRSELLAGNVEEIFLSKLMTAKIQSVLKMDIKTVRQSLIDAYTFRPSRLEPLYYLAFLYRNQGEYQKGYEIANLANQLPKEINDILAVETSVYTYGLPFEFASCASMTGHYVEGLDMCTKLIALENLSEAQRKEVEVLYNKLLQQHIEKIKEDVLLILKN